MAHDTHAVIVSNDYSSNSGPSEEEKGGLSMITVGTTGRKQDMGKLVV